MAAPPDVKSVFGKALDLEAPADRAAYLEQACGGDTALRGEVEGLLAALDRAGRFMSHPAVAPPDPAVPRSCTTTAPISRCEAPGAPRRPAPPRRLFD